MQSQQFDSRWDSPNHKTLNSGDEHARLAALETSSGHNWERTSFGEIKFFKMDRHCQGPMCHDCGFTFCVEWGAPDIFGSCPGRFEAVSPEIAQSGPTE
jgi:hypothetical protein